MRRVERLAEETYEVFGATHLLCNNAGVSPLGKLWEFTPDDWNWLLGVNFVGVVNGIRSFVPRMIASGQPGHIMNTGSGGSFQTQAIIGAYASRGDLDALALDSLMLGLCPERFSFASLTLARFGNALLLLQLLFCFAL